MLAKAICLVIATTTNVLTWLPPPSSKTVAAKKEQKLVETEHAIVTTHANTFPLVMVAFSVSSCLIHLFFMFKNATASEGSSSWFNSNPAVTQVGDLHAWHVVLTVFCVLGYALRKWAYVTLDQLYTYQLTIRTEHKLIQTGPYAFVRHPGYAGMLLNVLSYSHLMFYRGAYSAVVQYISYLVPTFLGIKVSIPLTVMGFDLAAVQLVVYYYSWYLGAVKYRIPHEETLLKEHFGKEWDAFASATHARLIPGVY
ncbi:hypothetical protein BGW39_008310 [Mortierella sp. 14UC]|nr:hypothetical protein BGW39_008310 [Mortierella sp. 14UC]